MSRKTLREYIDIMEKEGLEAVVAEKLKRGHVRITGRWRNHEYVGITSWTPSDRRTWLNVRADVRRWMRAHNT